MENFFGQYDKFKSKLKDYKTLDTSTLGWLCDIMWSFSLAASDETKRKMYSSILVVGGGLMFHGAQEFLLHRIINKMPPSFRRLVDNIEIITRPKVMQCLLSIPLESTHTDSTHVQAADALCVIFYLSHVTNLGYGPPAHFLERRSRAGLSGHHSGDVDPPAGVAALWRPDAT